LQRCARGVGGVKDCVACVDEGGKVALVHRRVGRRDEKGTEWRRVRGWREGAG
jgi:hypothetical protein